MTVGASLRWLVDAHRVGAYVAIVANAIAGIVLLVGWRVRRWRGRWMWGLTTIAEAAMLLQVLFGAILVASNDYSVPRVHMFYGFLAFLTVGLAYSYRQQIRGRRELYYGLVGLFIMGLGIRAVFQVS
jgi:hypothetical protein